MLIRFISGLFCQCDTCAVNFNYIFHESTRNYSKDFARNVEECAIISRCPTKYDINLVGCFCIGGLSGVPGALIQKVRS